MKEFNKKRYHWLSELINDNKFTIGAEVGVASGITTFYLMETCPNLQTLYAVDIWKHIPNSQWENMDTMEVFMQGYEKFKDRIILLEGFSWDKAYDLLEGSLDFVFIDADHRYESVKKDIIAWSSRLKPKGIISGHDIHLQGVVPALNELIPKWNKAGADNVWWAFKEDVKA